MHNRAKVFIDDYQYNPLIITKNKEQVSLWGNKKTSLCRDVLQYDAFAFYIKKASYLQRTAQPTTFAAFRPWRICQELVV